MTLRHDFIPRITISDADDCTTVLTALTIYSNMAQAKAAKCPCNKPACGYLVEAANAVELLELTIRQLDSITELQSQFGGDVC